MARSSTGSIAPIVLLAAVLACEATEAAPVQSTNACGCRHLLQTSTSPVPECDGHRCSGHSKKLAAHGWINAVTWGIIFPLVILLAHSLRRELSAWWFQLHRALAGLGLVLAIAGAATGGNLATDDYHGNSAGSAHKALGILAVVAAAVQLCRSMKKYAFVTVFCSTPVAVVCSGFVVSGLNSDQKALGILAVVAAAVQAVSTVIWRPLKAHRYRGLWDVGHHWLGRLAMLLAIAAIFTGIYISAVGWGYYVAYGATIAAFALVIGLKDIIDTFTGHKIRSVTMELAAQRKATTRSKDPAVAQTTDVVASHTGDKWTENSGGLYPYLKTKRGKVDKGKDNIHSSVQLPAPNGNASSGVEMTQPVATNGAENGITAPPPNGMTVV